MEIYQELLEAENSACTRRTMSQIRSCECYINELKHKGASNYEIQKEQFKIVVLKDKLIIDPKDDYADNNAVALEDRAAIIEYWLQFDFETIKHNYLKNIRSLFSVADNVRYVCARLNIQCPQWFLTKYNL